MFRWAGRRGLHPGAAALCGFILPLGRPGVPPLLRGPSVESVHARLGSLDVRRPGAVAGRGERRGLLQAGAAVALQILAGQVQYVSLSRRGGVDPRADPGPGAAGRPAAGPWRASRRRIFAGARAGGRAARSPAWRRPPRACASSGWIRSSPATSRLPPENLLTAGGAGLLRRLRRGISTGAAGFPWEMSLFLGVGGLLLLLGCRGRSRAPARGAGCDLAPPACCSVLALGQPHAALRAALRLCARLRPLPRLVEVLLSGRLFLVLAIGRGADALLRLRPPPAPPGARRGSRSAAPARPRRRRARGPARADRPAARPRSGTAARAICRPRLHRARDDPRRRHPGRAARSPPPGSSRWPARPPLALARRRPRAGLALLVLLPVETARLRVDAVRPFSCRGRRARRKSALFVAAHPGDYRSRICSRPTTAFWSAPPTSGATTRRCSAATRSS